MRISARWFGLWWPILAMAIIEIVYVVGVGLWGTAHGAAIAAIMPIVMVVVTMIISVSFKFSEDAPYSSEELFHLLMFSMACTMSVALDVAVFESAPSLIGFATTIVTLFLLFFVYIHVDESLHAAGTKTSRVANVRLSLVVPAAVGLCLTLDHLRIPFFFSIPLAAVTFLILAGIQFWMVSADYKKREGLADHSP